jgi:hypothetical protein
VERQPVDCGYQGRGIGAVENANPLTVEPTPEALPAFAYHKPDDRPGKDQAEDKVAEPVESVSPQGKRDEDENNSY